MTVLDSCAGPGPLVYPGGMTLYNSNNVHVSNLKVN